MNDTHPTEYDLLKSDSAPGLKHACPVALVVNNQRGASGPSKHQKPELSNVPSSPVGVIVLAEKTSKATKSRSCPGVL